MRRRGWIAFFGCVGAIEGRFGGVCGDDLVTAGGWIYGAHQRECVGRMSGVARRQRGGKIGKINAKYFHIVTIWNF